MSIRGGLRTVESRCADARHTRKGGRRPGSRFENWKSAHSAALPHCSFQLLSSAWKALFLGLGGVAVGILALTSLSAAHENRAMSRIGERSGASPGTYRTSSQPARPAGKTAAYIAAFRGFSSVDSTEVMGRVLADPPPALPDTDGTRWSNLKEQWDRFQNDHVAGVPVEIELSDGQRVQTVTDAQGYYRISLPPVSDLPPDGSLWFEARARVVGSDVHAVHEILRLDPDARYGIISDIDDTVLDSKVVDWRAAAELTFLHNVRTRKPLPGVAQLYRSLQQGPSGPTANPLFYVSSSPWNLYDLLETFLEINEIPHGPLLLREIDIGLGYFRQARKHGNKQDSIVRLFRQFPDLDWLLVGDSGQADAQIYADIAKAFPGRVLAIYIRDIDPDLPSPLDFNVDAVIERVGALNVPMLRVHDSDAIAEHARSIGLLPAIEVAEVATDVAREKSAPPQVEP